MTYLLIAAALVAVLGTWYLRYSKHAARFKESGYTPPASGMIAKFMYGRVCWLLRFLAVGKVKVIREVPLRGLKHAIYAANHQVPCDFAMMRAGSGSHLRMLTDSNQLGGFMGVLSAWFGVISVGFKAKTDGAAAEAACGKAVAEDGGALGIFPQGGLIPENVLNQKEFRPGCIRMARAAAAESGEPVFIVPMAIYYERDPKKAGFSHRFLGKTRSMFRGLRNPKGWGDPDFKVKLEDLDAHERAAVEARRKAKMDAYNKSKVTAYGGTVVVGKPINVQDLPADQFEAIEVIRLEIARLLEKAKA